MKWIEAAVATKSEEIDAVCEQLAALGAGGITKWLFDRDLRIERAANLKNIEEYINRIDEMVERKRALIVPEVKA